MPEPGRSEFSTRLRKLPRQLLLALINGTAMLVIAAAILAIIASSKVTYLAQNVASTMTDAVLSRVGGDPQRVAQNLQSVSDEVRTLLAALEQTKVDGAARLGPEIARLSEQLSSLEATIEQLRDARSRLIDEAIAKVGSSLSEGLQNFRACPRGEGTTLNPAAN
ncbi:MAG: hypothetical protein V3V97_14955 [Hyphomicrobiaceae bacterium]